MISIIIAMYNMEKYIEECLDSIFDQEFEPLEVIVVDDGSTDRSLEIAKKYPVKIIQQENSGQAAARNLALQHAKGEFIAYVDADDYLTENSLQRMWQLIQDTNSDMIITGYANVFENQPERIQIFEAPGQIGRLYTGTEVAEMMLAEQVRGFLVNKLFRRELIDRVNFHQEEGKYIEDLYPVFEAVIHSDKIAFLEGYTYNYRQRVGSSSNEKSGRLMYDYLSAATKVLKKAKDKKLRENAISAFEAITFLSLVNYYGAAHLNEGFGIYRGFREKKLVVKKPRLWKTFRNPMLARKRKLSLLLWDFKVYHLALAFWNRKKFGG